jgi:hypothetical protein
VTVRTYRPRLDHSKLSVLLVCLAAVLPYLMTVCDYFVADDFGVVHILSQKPAWYFPRWFVSSWMETVFGVPPHEIRPFPAISYQLTAFVGAVAPIGYHLLNMLIHAVNGILVLVIAREIAGLSVPAAATAAVLFVILPVHVESVAWITGRVDSLPALFYLASFLIYARWRATGSHDSARYLMSVGLFFAALFSKENTITMAVTLLVYDILIAKRPAGSSWLNVWSYIPYVPYLALTVAFLLLRYFVFGDLVRESQLPSDALAGFGDRIGRHISRMVVGSVALEPMAWTSLLAAAGLGLGGWWVRANGDARGVVASALYFGPVWMLVGLIPTIAATYESPRHSYLASMAWAMSPGFAIQAVWARVRSPHVRISATVVALAVMAAYLLPLRGALRTLHTAASISKLAVADLHREASSVAPGTLLIVGAPVRSWEWALPLVARPPFAPEDLTRRVFIVSPWLLHCCRTEWLDDTHRTLRAWVDQPSRRPIVVLHWDNVTGRLSRLTDADYPDLRTVISAMLEDDAVDSLDRLILRLTRLAARPVSPT